MKIALLANGPGEVWGWCRPLLAEIALRGWEADVHLLPCPYASGREMQALSSLTAKIYSYKNALAAFRAFAPMTCCGKNGNDDIASPRAASPSCGKNGNDDIASPRAASPSCGKRRKYDVVLQLGGDLMFGRFLAWRQKCPLVCYSYGRKKGMEKCDKILTSRRGLFDFDGLEIVGDLVLDSLDRGEPKEWNAGRGRRIAAFPGSRPKIRDRAFPLLCAVRDELLRRDERVELRVLLSPFADPNEAKIWRDAGFSVWQGTTSAGLCGADLALTQPGTNTLELMYCETPFIVTIPFSFLRLMPLSGVIGMIGKIPFVGAGLREFIIRRGLPKWVGRTSWPNRLAIAGGRESFLPELIGEYEGRDIAQVALELLNDAEKLASMRARLHELADEVKSGAPRKICDILTCLHN